MASVQNFIKHYQQAMEIYCDNVHKTLKYISKLDLINITVQHLRETGVGRFVNHLRTVKSLRVNRAARALVRKWKLMVASEKSDQETDNEIFENDGNSNGNHRSKYQQEEYETESKQEDKSNRHMNGDHNCNKRKNQSSKRCQEEGKKLKSLTGNIKIAQKAIKAPIKQTEMSYVDLVANLPRSIARRPAQHGTALAATARTAAGVAS
ncbi:transcription elongation factor B polypeptide 3-like isoform X2 [Pieris napi]|uniref:transcription elongation factor B polypeptide 3-like isoform X2 n=1 Tax=Pieris napi TaxID=78633 RepID=UPI001FBBA4F7|nr:transcription elongation factor B polypeptide 3-like isoform X2 [Pieris napi]